MSKTSFQSARNAALEGSVSSLRKFVDLLEVAGPSNLREALPVFQKRLQDIRNDLPETWEDPDKYPLDVASLCLQGIAVSTSGLDRGGRDLVNLISPVWPEMYPWIHHILEFYLVKKYDNLPEHNSPEDTLTYNIVDFIRRLTDAAPEIVPVLGKTKGFMALIGRVWNVGNAYDMGLIGRLNGIVRNMIGHHLVHDPDRPWVEEYQAAINAPDFDVVTPCMTRLTRVLRKRRPDIDALHRTLVAITNFGKTDSQSQHPMFRAGAVRKVADVLDTLVDHKLIMTMDLEEFRKTKGCMHIACLYLVQSFADSFHWVVEALESHILRAINKSTPFFALPPGKHSVDVSTQQTLESLFIQILYGIQAHTAIRPVLRQAVRELNVVEELDIRFTLGLSKHAPEVREAWISLVDAIEERKELRDAYDVSKQCDKVTQANPEDLPRLKQCPGCESAFYCSKECQKVAWELYHKEYCKQISELRKVGRQRNVNFREILFLMFVAKADVKAHMNKVKKLRQTHRKTSSRPPVITIDYTQVPYKIGVGSPEDFKDDCVSDFEDKEKEAQAGNGYLVRITCPQGPRPLRILDLVR